MTTVVGYHGCQRVFADGVRSGRITLDQWKPSQNVYDWLGEGIYFWEASRTRAEQWAIEQFGDQADVLAMDINLGQCLDLLESTYHDALRATYSNLREVYRIQGWTLPKNRKKRHDLDCLVINKFVKFMDQFAEKQGILFQTVRGVIEEGRPLFLVRQFEVSHTFRLRCGTFSTYESTTNGEDSHDGSRNRPGDRGSDPRRCETTA